MEGSLPSPGRRGLKRELYNAVEAAPGEMEGSRSPGVRRAWELGGKGGAAWRRHCGQGRALSVDGVQALLLL